MRQESIAEQFAVMTNAYAHYPFSYFLSSMRKLGLNQIDFWCGAPHFYAAEATPSKVAGLRNEIMGSGMAVVSYTPEMIPYPYDIAAAEPKLRMRTRDYLCTHIEIANELQAPYMLIPAGKGLMDCQRETNMEAMCEMLGDLAGYAKTGRTQLVLEHLTTNSSPLVNTSEDLAEVLRRVGAENLHCVLDLGQMSVFGETVSAFFDRLPDHIRVIHMMDGLPSAHLSFGDGILPLEKYYDEILDFGYQGKIVLEINDRRYLPDPHAALKQCIDRIRLWEDRP